METELVTITEEYGLMNIKQTKVVQEKLLAVVYWEIERGAMIDRETFDDEGLHIGDQWDHRDHVVLIPPDDLDAECTRL